MVASRTDRQSSGAKAPSEKKWKTGEDETATVHLNTSKLEEIQVGVNVKEEVR